MNINNDCCICHGNSNNELTIHNNAHYVFCKCGKCGHFYMPLEMWNEFTIPKYRDENSDLLFLIPGYINLKSKEIDSNIGINDKVIQYLRSNSFYPKKITEKIDYSIKYFVSLSKYFGFIINDLSIKKSDIFCLNDTEKNTLIEELSKNKFIEFYNRDGLSSNNFKVTLDGWKYFESLQKIGKESNKCFVAMWFDNSMEDTFINAIAPAISECGYEPFKINMKEHNSTITDEIIAEIRKCKFLIADLTGKRGGVYFEAGFAKGLGKEVIWTCKEGEEKDLHFDVRQYNFILWKSHEEFTQKLINRINATIV